MFETTTTTNDGGEGVNNQPEVGHDDGGATTMGECQAQSHTHTTTRQSNVEGAERNK